MALGQYKIKVVPVLDTASLHNQLEQAGVKGGKVGKAGQVGGEAYANGFARALKERFKYSIANALIYGTQAAVKDMVNNVRELDKAQTELRKVTNLSGKSLEDYTNRAYKMSGAVAKTGTEIIQAATEFSKQGFGTEDALKLSKVASEFQNIADTEIDAATAAKFINSQLKAFGNTEGFKHLTSNAQKAERVIDSVNEVANNFGVGTNDLQMALTKTGAALKGYGNSYAETIGLITAGTEMLPNQASKVARGWRTIGANVLKLAQSEETLSAANGKVNISLRDSNGNMKSTYAILKDLHSGIDGQSVAWEDLSQEEQSAISLMLAGKTQTEVFKSTMDNFSQAIKANETALKSQGSAARENAKYLDSIQGKTQAFKSAWEQLSYHLVDSSTIKAVIGFATTLIKGLDKVVEAVDKLPKPLATAIGLLTAFGVVAGGLKLLNVAEGFTAVGKAVASMGTTAKTTSGLVSFLAKDAATLARTGSILATTLGMVATMAVATGVAFAAANESYKNTFRGKVEEYHKVGSEISNIQSQIEALQSKEGELTGEEQTRLNILQMQLQVLQKQQEIKQKEVTQAFNKEAKKNLSKDVSGLAKDSQTPAYGEQYLKSQRQRLSLEKQIAAMQYESAKSGKVNAKQLEELNKQYEEAVKNEGDWLDKLIEQNDLLAEVSYDELDNWGKAYYDSIHKAYLQAQTDIRSVQDAVGRAVDTFGSQQFDSWNIDVSSLKNAADLADQIKAKLAELGEDEEITIYARDEAGNIIDEISYKKGELTDEEWELVIDATTTGNYDKLKEYVNSDPEHKEILMDFIEKGLGNIEKDKEDVAAPASSTLTFGQQGLEGVDNTKQIVLTPQGSTLTFGQKGLEGIGSHKQIVLTPQGTTLSFGQNGLEGINSHKQIVLTPQGTTLSFSESGLGGIESSANSTARNRTSYITFVAKKIGNFFGFAEGKRKGEQGGMAWLGDEGTAQNPKPELVVGEDGAYLAGTQGWELYPVKSSDTVYTATETKKLLANRRNFAITGGKELPRFAKGKEEKAKDEASRLVGLVKVGGLDVAKAVKQINKISGLDADDLKDYRAEAYKEAVSYNLKAFENGAQTRQKILDNIKSYYKTRGKFDETYYEMIDELRQVDKEKELKRLSELEEREENKLSYIKKYAQRQRDYYDDAVKKENEEAEALEKLVDLQDKLNNAKKTMVKVYKEGEGFVYEQDTQAIKEAQKALDDYNKEQQKTDLEKQAEAWQKIVDAIGEAEDLSEMKELELALGIKNISQITGKIGLDATKWGNLAKNILANQMGLQNIQEVLDKAEGKGIENLIGTTFSAGTKQVSSKLLSQYISKHKFANGSLNTPSGFSLVGENGPELRYLNKGSAIFSSDISRNLMEWGQYSPAQILNSRTGASQNQTFNFDKIVLPNVRNADEFYKELQQLPNRAIQQSAFRM